MSSKDSSELEYKVAETLLPHIGSTFIGVKDANPILTITDSQALIADMVQLVAAQKQRCEVCRVKTATRRGVENRGGYLLTFGYFCDTCIAYPCQSATKPENFTVAALDGVIGETDDPTTSK